MDSYKMLLNKWEQFGKGKLSSNEFTIQISASDEAQLLELQRLYPRLSLEEIVRDLLSAALNDVTEYFPYKQGDKVIAYDELGDAIYEDSGLTPKFLALTKKYRRAMTGASF